MPGPVAATVIIPALNAESWLPRQLRALDSQTFPGTWEVIVADNGSSDRTAESAEATRGSLNLRVVDASAQRGISYARNEGARHAKGSLLVFCDADDVVSRTWLAAMVDGLEHFDIVGGRLEYEHLNEAATRLWRAPIASDTLPTALDFLPFAVGANFGVRRRLFELLQGCDVAFPICCDDVDFCWRGQLSGCTIGFAKDAVVHYQLRTDLRSLARQQFAYGKYEARLYAKFRHLGAVRPGLLSALRPWWFLATRLHHPVRSAELRGRWVREASYRSGRIAGAIRFKTPYW